ncbi:MAG: hypothetical protein ABI266_05495, partial [Ginsengibacter sp.]
MKFNFFFLLFFLFNLSNVCAQDYIELPQSYFLDQSNLDDGKPLSIKMFINFHLKSMIESDSVKNLKGKNLSDYYYQAFKSKVVEIKPGIYFIDNDKQNFKFSIDNNGLLAGDGLLNNRVKNTETTFKFSSGIAINTVTKRLDKIYSRTTLKDSIFVAELFDKDGMMVTKDIINLKLGGGQSNTISTHYSKNGKISSEQNNINETFIVYYENGKIERQTDKKENWGKEFDKT